MKSFYEFAQVISENQNMQPQMQQGGQPAAPQVQQPQVGQKMSDEEMNLALDGVKKNIRKVLETQLFPKLQSISSPQQQKMMLSQIFVALAQEFGLNLNQAQQSMKAAKDMMTGQQQGM
jgi:hypothetical protein